MTDLKRHIRDVPGFPQPGIVFRDITPLLRERFDAALAAMDALLSPAEWQDIDAIAGIDARGFVLGAGLAARRGLGFVPVRKAGKLPPPVETAQYTLEYGTAALEMRPGSGRVLLVDDVMATGGTLRAAADLCRRAGHVVQGIAVLIDLRLAGDVAIDGHAVRSALRYG